MKNRSCRQGRLFSATDTLEGFDSPVPNDTATLAIAMGADKTFRPTSFFQVSSTLIVGSVLLEERVQAQAWLKLDSIDGHGSQTSCL